MSARPALTATKQRIKAKIGIEKRSLCNIMSNKSLQEQLIDSDPQ